MLTIIAMRCVLADVVASDCSYLGHEVDLRPRVGLCLLDYIVLVSSCIAIKVLFNVHRDYLGQVLLAEVP